MDIIRLHNSNSVQSSFDHDVDLEKNHLPFSRFLLYLISE